jgi:hypothetical protein
VGARLYVAVLGGWALSVVPRLIEVMRLLSLHFGTNSPFHAKTYTQTMLKVTLSPILLIRILQLSLLPLPLSTQDSPD